MHQKFLSEKTEGKIRRGRPRRTWEDNIRIDLRGICGKLWTGFIWLRMGPMEWSCEHWNEPSGFI